MHECNLNIDAIQDEAELSELAEVFYIMAQYTSVKYAAVKERKAGRIVSAQSYEKSCELIYKQLPQKWKW